MWQAGREGSLGGNGHMYVKFRKIYRYIAQGTLLNVMWQPGWEGSLGENGYMYMYG